MPEFKKGDSVLYKKQTLYTILKAGGGNTYKIKRMDVSGKDPFTASGDFLTLFWAKIGMEVIIPVRKAKTFTPTPYILSDISSRKKGSKYIRNYTFKQKIGNKAYVIEENDKAFETITIPELN